jgi:PAS domain-containing protein
MDSASDPRSLAAELHRIRGILNTQNFRFDLVLEKMRQGLCLFDASARLIVANRRYAELYGIAPESIQLGMELREIVDLRVAAGSLPRMTQVQYLEWRSGVATANKPADSVVGLCNGRVIHIHHEPLPDFGWVATHDDITDQRRAEDELRRRNLHFDAAIANMSQGLCMFDANERMIVCNLNYPTMFGICKARDQSARYPSA